MSTRVEASPASTCRSHHSRIEPRGLPSFAPSHYSATTRRESEVSEKTPPPRVQPRKRPPKIYLCIGLILLLFLGWRSGGGNIVRGAFVSPSIKMENVISPLRPRVNASSEFILGVYRTAWAGATRCIPYSQPVFAWWRNLDLSNVFSFNGPRSVMLQVNDVAGKAWSYMRHFMTDKLLPLFNYVTQWLFLRVNVAAHSLQEITLNVFQWGCLNLSAFLRNQTGFLSTKNVTHTRSVPATTHTTSIDNIPHIPISTKAPSTSNTTTTTTTTTNTTIANASIFSEIRRGMRTWMNTMGKLLFPRKQDVLHSSKLLRPLEGSCKISKTPNGRKQAITTLSVPEEPWSSARDALHSEKMRKQKQKHQATASEKVTLIWKWLTSKDRSSHVKSSGDHLQQKSHVLERKDSAQPTEDVQEDALAWMLRILFGQLFHSSLKESQQKSPLGQTSGKRMSPCAVVQETENAQQPGSDSAEGVAPEPENAQQPGPDSAEGVAPQPENAQQRVPYNVNKTSVFSSCWWVILQYSSVVVFGAVCGAVAAVISLGRQHSGFRGQVPGCCLRAIWQLYLARSELVVETFDDRFELLLGVLRVSCEVSREKSVAFQSVVEAFLASRELYFVDILDGIAVWDNMKRELCGVDARYAQRLCRMKWSFQLDNVVLLEAQRRMAVALDEAREATELWKHMVTLLELRAEIFMMNRNDVKERAECTLLIGNPAAEDSLSDDDVGNILPASSNHDNNCSDPRENHDTSSQCSSFSMERIEERENSEVEELLRDMLLKENREKHALILQLQLLRRQLAEHSQEISGGQPLFPIDRGGGEVSTGRDRFIHELNSLLPCDVNYENVHSHRQLHDGGIHFEEDYGGGDSTSSWSALGSSSHSLRSRWRRPQLPSRLGHSFPSSIGPKE